MISVRAPASPHDPAGITRNTMIYQLFGVGALAHRGLPPVRGLVWKVSLAFPAPHPSAREGCPGHCGTLTGLGGNSNSGYKILYVIRSIGTKLSAFAKMTVTGVTMNKDGFKTCATASGWLPRSCVVWSACGSRSPCLRANFPCNCLIKAVLS